MEGEAVVACYLVEEHYGREEPPGVAGAVSVLFWGVDDMNGDVMRGNAVLKGSCRRETAMAHRKIASYGLVFTNILLMLLK